MTRYPSKLVSRGLMPIRAVGTTPCTALDNGGDQGQEPSSHGEGATPTPVTTPTTTQSLAEPNSMIKGPHVRSGGVGRGRSAKQAGGGGRSERSPGAVPSPAFTFARPAPSKRTLEDLRSPWIMDLPWRNAIPAQTSPTIRRASRAGSGSPPLSRNDLRSPPGRSSMTTVSRSLRPVIAPYTCTVYGLRSRAMLSSSRRKALRRNIDAPASSSPPQPARKDGRHSGGTKSLKGRNARGCARAGGRGGGGMMPRSTGVVGYRTRSFVESRRTTVSGSP